MDHLLEARQALCDTEQNLIIEHFSSPEVKKYLHFLADGLIQDLLEATPAPGQSDSEYVREQERWRGALAVYNSLLSIGNKE